MFIKNLKLEVIATYNNFHEDLDGSQELFLLRFLTKDVLKSEKSLINYIKKQLSHKKDLVKLSLCWSSKDIKNLKKKYKTIQQSIDKNAKYYFRKD